jgi:hypothetical protein
MATTVTDRELVGEDISVHLSAQTTKGSVDANPEFFKVKRVGGAPKQTVSSTTSSTLSNSQNGKQNIQTNSEQAAELSTEVFTQTKDLLVAAIHSELDDNSYTGADVEITATGLTFQGADTLLSAGDFLFLQGATDDDNNITYNVQSVTGNDVVLNPAPAATEAVGVSITVASKKYANGLTPTYFLGQRRQLDKSAVGELTYFNFADGLIDSLSLEIPEAELMTATTNLLWETASDSRVAITGQTDAAEDTSEAAGVENQFKKFWLNGAPSECILKSASLEIANGYQSSAAAGCKRNSLGGRQFAVTGSFVAKNLISDSAYWEELYLAGSRVDLAFEIVWSDGKSMVIQVEQAYLSEHEQSSETGFSNSTLSISAEENPSTNSTIRVFTSF